MKTKLTFVILLLITGLCTTQLSAQRYMERLNRGTVAIRKSPSEVFIAWRISGIEYTGNATYNLYRGSTLIASGLDVSNYTDKTSTDYTYRVAAVIDGTEQTPSSGVTPWSNFYTTVPLSPISKHHANDASVADLDGDGDLEFVLKWEADNSKDNSQKGITDVVYLEGLEMDGTSLWRINLGINIRAGAHYTQFMVYDLDGDGKAEVACKTAPGTKDGTGSYLSLGPAASDNDGADYRNSRGYVLSGPEYLTIFNGQTGAEMATVNYVPARGSVSSWGDSYGNRVDRFLACIAYLDGTRPSLVMCRGYYTRSVLAAWDWRNGSLTQRWVFDTDNGHSSYAGQGNHQVSVADIDEDGKDEIVYGAMAVDDDGTGLWNSRLGHGDAMHVSDIDPNRPGLERWGIHEGTSTPGSALLDARTGAVIWKTANADVGRGASADLDASNYGMECWGGTNGVMTATNSYVGSSPYANFVIWWDGDLSRELCNADRIDKYLNGSTSRLVTVYNYESSSTNNGTKKNPCLQGDILGDWREELVTRSSDNTKLIIFTTTDPTDISMYTLMHDPQYRLSIAWQNVAYNQPPHTGFYLGNGMGAPPVPNIQLIGGDPLPGSIALEAKAEPSLVELSWTKLNISSSFEIYRDTDSDPTGRTRISTVSNNTSDYTDATVSNGTTYYYWIKATDDQENTVNSNAASATPSSDIPITIQENENGFCGVDGTIDNNNAGYTGDGFANSTNEAGAGIDWAVNGAGSTCTLTWNYANGGSTDRSAVLYVNGTSVAPVNFPTTGGWTTWATTSVNLDLGTGYKYIRLEADQSSGLANIDYISITGNDQEAADCNGTTITYTLTTSVSGEGTVSGAGTYNEGTTVTLTATPATGYTFTGWSGDASGSSTPAIVTMDSDKSVTATFEAATPEDASLTINVVGSGTVSPSSGTYTLGDIVTLTATASKGNSFTGWSGDISSTSTSVSLTMDADKSVTATFEESGTDGCEPPLTISVPFTREGVGEYCWQTSDDISNINSWGLDLLEINNIDYTNSWSNNMPDKVDGYYKIHFVSSNDWGHFEAAALKSAAPDNQEISLSAKPNPFTNSTAIIYYNEVEQLVDITLYDMAGKQVKQPEQKVLFKGLQIIPLKRDNLKQGVYMLMLKTKLDVKTLKLIVE